MSNFVLITDATIDLPADVVKALDIEVIPMEFEIEGTSYYHYPDEREMSSEAFYQQLKAGKMPTTAQVTPYTYEQVFTGYLEQGKDVLAVIFSSGLSGSFNSATIAAQNVREEFPERKLYCIDSLCASVGEGILLYHVAKKRLEGMDIDSLAQWIQENRTRVAHWFTVEDLFHLNRGGRVSAVSAVVGSALKIKPILSVDNAGKLTVVAKARGDKKAMAYLMDHITEDASPTENDTVLVGHASNIEAAKRIRDTLLENGLVKDVIITNIGPIIGTHVGQGMVALVFLNKEQVVRPS
jgi:DegV family protein with EDD domain